MRIMSKLLVAAAAAAILSPAASIAATTVTVSQVGSDVVVTTVGTLDLTGLTLTGAFSLPRGALPARGYVATGTIDGGFSRGYSGFTGPDSFGTSTSYTSASSGTGIGFGINARSFGSPYVFVQDGFVSGGSVAGTATFANTTLAALGFTQGSYAFRSSADTLTIDVGATPAVPEPATWAMMLVGFGGMGAALRRRRRDRVTFA